MKRTIRATACIAALLCPAAALAQSAPDMRLCVALNGEFAAIARHLAAAGADCHSASATTGHCQWRFGYRADQARDLFQGITGELRHCPGLAGLDQPEPAVNHPDSYEQHRFAYVARVISVSLKDKAQLGATFVFLRVGAAGD